MIVQRKRLGALLAGTLQDVFASQTIWEHVELNASSKWSLRLLEVLSTRQHVQSLIVNEPSELVLEFMASWLRNQQSTCARVDHLAIRSGTLLQPLALVLGEGLSSEFCTVVSLEIGEVSFDSWDTVQGLARGLAGHRHLEKAAFQSCHLEDVEVAAIVQALEHHPSLAELRLSINYCQEEGTLALYRLLKSPSASLRILDVSYQDNWDDRQYFAHYASALSDPLCPLKELNLASNFVDDEQFRSLIEALRTNTQLKSLNLRDNRITDIGLRCLLQVLPELSALKKLDISNNRYGRQACQDVQQALCAQTTLTSLSIDHSQKCVGIAYYLALNRAGRYCKSAPRVPLGVWPLILERCRQVLTLDDREAGISHADILFDLVRGPALLER